MGRRKTKKIKPSKSSLALKNRNKLDREFHCHFCQHDRSVSIKIDMRSAVGFLTCRMCGVNFSTRVTSLDEPIDVYTTWMDKCRETEKIIQSKEPVKAQKPEHKPPVETYGEKSNNVDTDSKMLESNFKDEPLNVEVEDTDNMENLFEPQDQNTFKENRFETSVEDVKAEYSDNPNMNLTNDSDIFENEQLELTMDEVGLGETAKESVYTSVGDVSNPDSRVHDLFKDDDTF